MEPRDYQTKFIESVEAGWKDYRKQLGVAPVGSGKTIVFSWLAKRRLDSTGQRTLVIANRNELVDQAISKLRSATGIFADKEKAEFSARFHAPVVVASIQTMARRLHKWAPDHFGLVIVDEADQSITPQWMSVLNHFDKFAHVCGVSVGPNSFVELKGGCFGHGFVGPVESAFETASRISMPRPWFGFEVIDLAGVFSRGWDGNTFRWKPCHRILRHPGKPCVSLNFQGGCCEITPDHSVYKAIQGEAVTVTKKRSKNRKFKALVTCESAGKLSMGDLLLGDSGNNYDDGSGKVIDMIPFCLSHMPQSRVTVVCNVKSIPRQELRLFSGHKRIYAWRTRGALPIKVYNSLTNPPPVEHLRVEGSKSSIVRFVNLQNWAYVLGFYLGDGWVCSDKRSQSIGFAVGSSQVDDLSERLKSLVGLPLGIRVRKMPGKSSEIKTNNIFLSTILKSIFGDIRCYDKFIPGDWTCSWSYQSRLQLLAGMIDSDGCVCAGKQNRLRHVFTTTSSKLAKGICSLLRSLGLWGSIHQRKYVGGGVISGRSINGSRLAYSVYWSDKKTSSSGHNGKRCRFFGSFQSFTEAPVRSVKPSETPKWVYDLEMEGHPSFVADGILVHNTATPDRGDQKDLGCYYENIAYQISMVDLIKQGYLCPISIKSLPVKIDLSSVTLDQGDLDRSQVGHALEPYLDEIAYQIKINAADRKTVCFLPLISTSQKFVEACRRVGLTSEHVDGESPDRTEKLQRFERGEFQLLSNAMLVVRGWDCPPVSCVVVLRGTKVRSFFVQCVGRGTRLHETKKDLLILDPLWLHRKHDICRSACLVSESQEEANTMMEVIDGKTAIPGSVAENLSIDLMTAMTETAVKREDALRKKLEALSKRRATFISAEEFALNAGDVNVAEYMPVMPSDIIPPTQKQIEYLNRAKIDTSTVQGHDHASKLIGLYFKQQDARPADRRVKFMMSKLGWRSKDNLRGPWQATMKDQRQFWAEQPRKSKKPKKQPQTTFWE